MNTVTNKIHYFVIAVLLVLTGMLFIHRDHYYVVDADFFGQLMDGRKMLSLQYAHYKNWPLLSILIALFEMTLPVRYPGIQGVLVVNIISFAILAYVFWRILQKYYGNYGIAVWILYITNFFVYLTHLRVLNNAVFTLVSIVVIYLEMNGRRKASRLLAGFSFFVRVEGALLVLALLVSDLLQKRRKELRYDVFSFCIVTLYLVGILGIRNEFIFEIEAKIRQIPNWRFLYDVFITVPVGKYVNIPLAYWMPMAFWIGAATWYYVTSGMHEFVFIGIYSLLFIASHTLFPETDHRYAYPFLWLLYFMSFLVYSTRAERIQETAHVFINRCSLDIQLYSYKGAS